MNVVVYFSVGSNLGDREENLRQAIGALLASSVRVLRISPIYETEPVDFRNQPWFLNCVVEAETALEPLALLYALRAIESDMGSQKEFAKGPRLLDIDILLYGDEAIKTPQLEVPHPRMTQRRFVLAPLVDLAPQLHHPSWPGTAAELLAELDDPSTVRVLRV